MWVIDQVFGILDCVILATPDVFFIVYAKIQIPFVYVIVFPKSFTVCVIRYFLDYLFSVHAKT
ncbi:MAG: hypothetical protein VW270_30500, partial [Candidatus Poseidoniales archaeon]